MHAKGFIAQVYKNYYMGKCFGKIGQENCQESQCVKYQFSYCLYGIFTIYRCIIYCHIVDLFSASCQLSVIDYIVPVIDLSVIAMCFFFVVVIAPSYDSGKT